MLAAKATNDEYYEGELDSSLVLYAFKVGVCNLVQ